MTKQEFITQVAKYVQKYASSYGILVHSPIIAQAILESGWGESKLSSLYHNYFGLKCGSKWKGKSVNMTTQEEYIEGTYTTIKDNFRVYASMEEGVKGYFEFIQLSRYHNLRGIKDPKKYLETIKADGYATSSKYVENLLKVITQYNLTKYDETEDTKMSYSRQKVVDLVCSWEGLKESNGSFKKIIDIYNTLPTAQLPRRTKMLYSWEWCACTWSALAVKLGYLPIMPIEISCYYIIENAKKMGCWQENDAYVPKAGDAVLYDWDDSGKGDNKGGADHIGTVIEVYKSAGYMVVMEGNYGQAVKKRTISLNGRYIRGFITPKYTENTVSKPVQESGKSIDTIAREVIAGKWNTGAKRKSLLEAKGYDYNAVQKRVNEILNGSASKPSTTPTTPQSTSKKVTATCSAKNFNKSLAGTYKTTADLYMRNDAGTNKKALVCIPKGTAVKMYGYYNVSGGAKWYYIQVTLNGVQYTGFSHSAYLKKA